MTTRSPGRSPGRPPGCPRDRCPRGPIDHEWARPPTSRALLGFCLLVPCLLAVGLAPAVGRAAETPTEPQPDPLPGVVVLEDARGDGAGPGTYLMPRGRPFSRGAFDLVSVTLRPEGDDVFIEVELAGRAPVARDARASRDAQGHFLLLQVDLYIDTDRRPGSGETRTFPGRRVLLDPADAWERAVIITALPGRVATGLQHAAPELARHILVVEPLSVRGRTVVARVPRSALGGTPSPDWGYTVLTSSLTLAASIRSFVLGRGEDANVFTREVTSVPGTCENWEEEPDGRPCTFGGCEPCEGHPRVLDALVAGSSEEQLARYGPSRWATLHAAVPSGRRPTPDLPPLGLLRRKREETPPDVSVALPCPDGGRFPVSDRDGAVVTVAVAERRFLDGIEPGRIGDLLDARGEVAGRAVVVRRSGVVLVAERVDGAGEDAPAPAAITFRCKD